MSAKPIASEFCDHTGLRNDLEKAILTHARLGKDTETDSASLLRLVDATSEAVELCGKLQRAAVHQARRSDIPWSEIGSVMGITRQAAQQRFAPDDVPQAIAQTTRRISGANAFNEMQILASEGKAGYHLIGFGPQFLTVMASTDTWEHRRVSSFNIISKRTQLESDGWVYIGSWFPFHYFKRIVK